MAFIDTKMSIFDFIFALRFGKKEATALKGLNS